MDKMRLGDLMKLLFCVVVPLPKAADTQTGELPPHPSVPVIVPEVSGNTVLLRCSFEVSSSGSLGFVVAWSRLSPAGRKEELKQETTLHTSAVIELDGFNLRLGDKIFCSSSSFFLESPDVRGTTVESQEFFAGIKLTPEATQISEDGRLYELVVESTVPVPCPDGSFSIIEKCSLPLQLSTTSPGDDPSAPDLSFTACEVHLSSVPCVDRVCGRALTHFSAITDFVSESEKATRISVKPGVTQSFLWNGYSPEPVQILVQDVPPAYCYSFTDPHVVTFDGRYYENFHVGTFVLYKSDLWPFEVHVRQWECGGLVHAASCACGFVARDAGDIIAFDMCDGVKGETRPRLTVKRRDLAKNSIRITEAYNGRKVTMTFTSGAFVRADVSDWGMSLTLRAPGSDRNRTQGLCGTFDGHPENDFHSAQGAGLEDVQSFISEWRLPPGSSLFDALPSSPASPKVKHKHCMCQTHFSTSSPTDGSLSTTPTCSGRGNTRFYGIIPARDVTDQYLKSVERQTGSERLKFQSKDSRKRPRQRGPPLSSRKRVTVTETQNRRSIEDHEPAAAQFETPPAWPTPFGLTQQQAEAQCRLTVEASAVAVGCRPLLDDKALGHAVVMCVADLQLKDEESWLGATLPLLENECERRLVEAAGGGTNEDYTAARDILRCPDMCSGNGQCLETGCVCFPGFGTFDCSAVSDQVPEIHKLEDEGLCDVRRNACSTVQLLGQGFRDSSELKCEFVREQFKDGEWVQDVPRFVPASLLNSTSLECRLPPLPGHPAASLETLTSWQIKVSNDGHSFSNTKILTLFDGACQTCTSPPDVICTLKEKTCSIDGVCYREGESRSGSTCFFCRPDSSTSSWSPAEKNEPPLFRPPPFQLRSVQDEDFTFQLQAHDPEGSPLVFSLLSGPAGAALSPGGLLMWRAAPQPVGTPVFHFTVTDDCAAQTTASVQVSVQLCDCLNGASCVTALRRAAAVCVCPEGFTGQKCEADVDDCKPNPCRLGRCIDGLNSFTCICPAGMTGPTCREDVDECVSEPCFPGVICRNTLGSFSCGSCPEDYGGDGQKCNSDVDSPGRMVETSAGVFQAPPEPKPKPAVPGACSRQPCHPGVECFQTTYISAGFVCGPCPPGFRGNGITCAKTGQDSLPSEPPGHSLIVSSGLSTGDSPASTSPPMQPRQSPERKSSSEPARSGSRRVSSITSTAAAARPDQASCSDTPCFPGAPCEALSSGSFRCGRCPAGYTGDGVTCKAVCRYPCGSNMECSRPNTCTCKDGYTGYNCHIAVCRPDCKNQGKCVRPDVCECPAGYAGPVCAEASCDPPCRHGGTCQGRNLCTCPYGYVGPRCETMVCNRHCENGGQCVSPDVCQCKPGWFGPTCHSALCDPVCLNGGTCVRPNVCACPGGFFGLQCQIAVCSPPCKNGGQCMRNNVCSCPEGYTGQRCQRSVCEPTCMNGGKCVGANTCSCASGWSGERCNSPVCLQKCKNGGECVGPNICHCPVGWEGLQCQTAVCKQKCLNGARCVLPDFCYCRRGYKGRTCAEKASSA